MKNKIYRLFVVIALACTVMMTACTANGDWTSNGGNCDNGATCVYNFASQYVK